MQRKGCGNYSHTWPEVQQGAFHRLSAGDGVRILRELVEVAEVMAEETERRIQLLGGRVESDEKVRKLDLDQIAAFSALQAVLADRLPHGTDAANGKANNHNA